MSDCLLMCRAENGAPFEASDALCRYVGSDEPLVVGRRPVIFVATK